MAGHSKWANIKHRKQGVDKKRGLIFTKLVKELMVAVKTGGSDPNGNTRLRLAISRARSCNMPNHTIERSIKKGAGELDSINYEEISYEVFGPGGVGIIIESLTDKKSRTTPEIKNILSKYNASISETNSVRRFFKRRGVVIISSKMISEERLMEISIDAGAEDIQKKNDQFLILSSEEDYATVLAAVEREKIKTEDSGIQLIPHEGFHTSSLTEKQIDSIKKLIEILTEHEDVQSVFTTID